MIRISPTCATLSAGTRFLPQSLLSQLLSTEVAGIITNPLSRPAFCPHAPLHFHHRAYYNGQTRQSLRQLRGRCPHPASLDAGSRFARRSRPRREMAPILAAAVRPVLKQHPWKRQPKPNLEAPGGTLVMESLVHTGMYAPTETLIFHHIILVCTFAY
jgi:hypothetical protein